MLQQHKFAAIAKNGLSLGGGKLVFAVLLGAMLLGCGPQTNDDPLVGTNISDVTFERMSGGELPLYVYRDSRPVVVNFWATWCPPCVKELPSLQALAKRGDIQVITISTDRYLPKLEEFLKRHNLQELKVLRDPQGSRSRAYWGVEELPTTFITSTDLTIVAVEKGERDWASDAMVEKIKTLAQAAEAKANKKK